MRVMFAGGSHLAETLRKASERRGIEIGDIDSDVVFLAIDVLDHKDTRHATSLMAELCRRVPETNPIVIVSQVPPGYSRAWSERRGNIYCQVDTIIMNRALERATYPAQIIVGCSDPRDKLPDAYAQWLVAFNCPIRRMSYESAELTKLAINYMLAKQIEAANDIAEIATSIGANYDDMLPALRCDDRIGKGYIVPGKINQHLKRDVDTIRELLHGRSYHRRGQPDRQGAGTTVAGKHENGCGNDPQISPSAWNAAIRSAL